MTGPHGPMLDALTRLRGIRGAMVVSVEDGLVVAESLMAGIKGAALAALAANLASRTSELADRSGVGTPRFLHLQAEEGALLVAPATADLVAGGGCRPGGQRRPGAARDAAGWRSGSPDAGHRALGAGTAARVPHRIVRPAGPADDRVGAGGGAARLHPRAGRHVGGGAGRRHHGVDRGAGAPDGLGRLPGWCPTRAPRGVAFRRPFDHAAGPLDRAGGVRAGDLARAGAAVLRPDGRGTGRRGAAARRRPRRGARRGLRDTNSTRACARSSDGNRCRSSTSRPARSPARSSTTDPGRSGKTTNLQYIYGRVPEIAPRPDGRRSPPRPTGPCSSISFRSISGVISGFTTRFQLYTVPGQVYYNATRKLVLQGADGVVFVGRQPGPPASTTTSRACRTCRKTSWRRASTSASFPVVFQYNKQDLPRDLILSRRTKWTTRSISAAYRSFAGRRAAWRTACSRRCKGISETGAPAPGARGARPRDHPAQSPLPVRRLRGRRGQPAGGHGGAGRGRVARARSTTPSSSMPAPASARPTC